MAVTSLQFAGLTIPPAASLNAAASQRALAGAGARALVPLTYGTDRVGALLLNVLVSGTDASVLLVQCLWGHACDAVDELRLNDQALPAGSVVISYTGAQTTADVALVGAFAAQGITYTDTLTGYAYSVIAMPSRSFTGALDASARVRGRRVYDPRKDTTAGGAGAHRLATPATWEWSDNPSLCLADWLASSTYGPAEPVLWSSVPAAANANDATVGAAAEKRRTIGLTMTQPVSMVDLVEALRAYAGCWLMPASGGMRLIADTDAVAVASYSHDAGQIAELGALVLRDRGNSPTAVEVTYTDASQIPYRDASATASLPGAGTTLPWRLSGVRLPGVHRYSQALREATERLNKLTLADLTTDAEVFDVGIAHDLADIVTITHPIGLVAKAMRVTGIEMPAAGRWRLSLTEHDPLVYSASVVTLASTTDTPRVAPAGPPDDVAGLTGTLTQGAVRWAWTQSAVSDYAETRLRIGASWAAGAPLWAGRANSYTHLVDVAGTYTLWAKHYNRSGLESLAASSASATLTSTDINAPGSSQATVYLYQWGNATQPGNPSGQTTYTWGTGSNTTYTGGNDWLVAVAANPGTAGGRLWVARKAILAPAGTVSSAVSWAAGYTISAESINGAQGGAGQQGVPGIKAATPTVYQWAASIPTIAGSATYTWAAADLGTLPGVWTAAPGSGSPGQTLWGASVSLVDASGATTTAIDWSGASITARGYAGNNGGAGQTGISARRAYALTTATSLGGGTVTTNGISSLPATNTVFGSGLTWAATPATPGTGQVLYQSDGLYNPATDQINWETPYISALKVGNLAALAVNTGALTVNDTLTMGTGGVVRASNWTAGAGGLGWRLTETDVELPATGIRGQLTAGQINANGLSIKNASGVVILNAGPALDFNSRFGDTTGIPANGATVGAQWGINLSGQPADTDILNTHTQGGVTVVNHPGGGNVGYNAASQFGAIKIRLPQWFSATMLRFFVEVYEYTQNKSFTLEIGGYNYFENIWYNCYAKMVGSAAAEKVVRFGHDGTKCCIWIGEPDSVWEYPQITVTNFRAGYSNQAASLWNAGWQVALDTSVHSGHSITATEASPLTGASWSQIPGGTGKAADNATVGATWGSNLAGRPDNLAGLTGAEGILNSLLSGSITAAAATALWSNIAGQANAPANNATVGAPEGTLVGGVDATTVASGAGNGASALTAVNDATTGLAQRLRSNAQNVLAGPGGIATGSLTWDSSGARTGGYGVGMTATGLAAYSATFGATPSFVIGTDGNITLRGTVYATAGEFSGSLNVNSGGSNRMEITATRIKIFNANIERVRLGDLS